MRACANCGDWIGEAITACPKCGAEVAAAPPSSSAAPPGTWGTAPVPPAPQPQYQPPAPPYGQAPYGQAPYGQAPYGAPPQAPYGAPPQPPAQYGQATPYGAYAYGAPPVPKKKHTGLIVLFSVLGVVAVLFAAAVVVGLVIDDGSQKELSAYLDGEGVSYRFPGDKAQVRLAVEPKYQSQPVGATEMELAIIEKRHYEMAFGRIEVPGGLQGADVRAALVASVQGGADSGGVKIGAIQDVRVDGHPAVWAHGTVKGDEADITTVYVDGTVYMLLVHTEDDSTDLQRELERSFEAGR